MEIIKLTGKQILELAQFAGLSLDKELLEEDGQIEYEIWSDSAGIPIKEEDGTVKKYACMVFISEYPDEGGLALGDEISA